MPEVVLTAVAARTPAKREQTAAVFAQHRPGHLPQAPVCMYEDAFALLADPHVDVVAIATPPHLHTPLTWSALQAGKHVFLEKPGALSAHALAECATLAEQRGLALTVNLVMRHHPLIALAGELLQRHICGRIEHLTLRNEVHRVAPGHWFWDPVQSGGIWVEHGVHFFEVARYWLGPPADLPVQAGTAAEPSGEAARVWANVCFRGPRGELIPAHFYHGFTRPQEQPELTQWDVLGQHGRLLVDGWVPQTLTLEAVLPPARARQITRLFTAVPRQPTPSAAQQTTAAASRLLDTPAAPVPSGRPVRLTLHLPDRQGWYRALVQARFLDLLAMMEQQAGSGVPRTHTPPSTTGPCQSGRTPLISVADAVADLSLAEACTAAQVSVCAVSGASAGGRSAPGLPGQSVPAVPATRAVGGQGQAG